MINNTEIGTETKINQDFLDRWSPKDIKHKTASFYTSNDNSIRAFEKTYNEIMAKAIDITITIIQYCESNLYTKIRYFFTWVEKGAERRTV